MFNLIASVASPLIKSLFSIIDQVVDDDDLALRLKTRIAEKQHDIIESELKGAIDIIIAEAQGSWMQRNWRPCLMLSIVAIIINNYIILPYANAFGLNVPMLELPSGLWALMTTGVGGYVLGRSGEKITQIRQLT